MAEEHRQRRQIGDGDLALPDRCTGLYCDSNVIIYQTNVTLYTWSEICDSFEYSYEFCLKCLQVNTPDLSDIQREYLNPNYGLWEGFCNLPMELSATYPDAFFDTLIQTKSVKTKHYNGSVSTILTTQTKLMPNPHAFTIRVTAARTSTMDIPRIFPVLTRKPATISSLATATRSGSQIVPTLLDSELGSDNNGNEVPPLDTPNTSALDGVIIICSVIGGLVLLGSVACLIRKFQKRTTSVDKDIEENSEFDGDSLVQKLRTSLQELPDAGSRRPFELPDAGSRRPFELPVSLDHLELPVSLHHLELPVSLDYLELPVSLDYLELQQEQEV